MGFLSARHWSFVVGLLPHLSQSSAGIGATANLVRPLPAASAFSAPAARSVRHGWRRRPHRRRSTPRLLPLSLRLPACWAAAAASLRRLSPPARRYARQTARALHLQTKLQPPVQDFFAA